MGTKTLEDFRVRMDAILQDPERVRWPDAERDMWINDGQRTTVLLRPDALATTFELTTVAGSLQRLPAESLRLMDVKCNIKAGGVEGRAIRLAAEDDLNTNNPSWHSVTGPEAKVYITDLRDPKVFYLYPVPPVGSKVRVVDSRTPGDMVGTTPMTLDDLYFAPILNYALARCYSKDAEYVPKLAGDYMGLFTSEINAKTAVDGAVSPNAVGTKKP